MSGHGPDGDRIAGNKEDRGMEFGNSLAHLGAGLGAGLAVIGGGLGIGRLAAAAMEGSARQPQAIGDIRTSMIIAAALIEGATLFALVICMILGVK
jgi:F-type H+-transporting ATPase subunit c